MLLGRGWVLWDFSDQRLEKLIINCNFLNNFQNNDVPQIVPSEFRKANENISISQDHKIHPLTGETRRYICGDRFHNQTEPHKSHLCLFHDIDTSNQSSTIKTSFQESLNHKKNLRRNRASCVQDILHHIFYNYLMNYYDNEQVVSAQKNFLTEKYSKKITRDEYLRFKLC